MTIFSVIFLSKIPFIYIVYIYMVLANPTSNIYLYGSGQPYIVYIYMVLANPTSYIYMVLANPKDMCSPPPGVEINFLQNSINSHRPPPKKRLIRGVGVLYVR